MHTTVAHYASIQYPIPNMGSGVVFFGERISNHGGVRRVGKTDKWSPAWKICPICKELKLFARANNKVCSRKCAATKTWSNRK